MLRTKPIVAVATDRTDTVERPAARRSVDGDRGSGLGGNHAPAEDTGRGQHGTGDAEWDGASQHADAATASVFSYVGRSDGGDRPLVVGAAVRSPHDGGGADRRVTGAVQGCAGAPVDDLVAAVADAVEPPLLVVATVPRRLHGVRAVGGVAPAVRDHAVG